MKHQRGFTVMEIIGAIVVVLAAATLICVFWVAAHFVSKLW